MHESLSLAIDVTSRAMALTRILLNVSRFLQTTFNDFLQKTGSLTLNEHRWFNANNCVQKQTQLMTLNCLSKIIKTYHWRLEFSQPTITVEMTTNNIATSLANQINSQNLTPFYNWQTQLTLAPTMTVAQLVTVIFNTHLDNHIHSTCDMTPLFKPSTTLK